MTSIPPLISTYPLINPDNTPSTEFKRWCDQILERIGGISGGSYQALKIESGNVLWDLDKKPVAIVVLTGNVTIPNPTSMVAGLIYRLTVVQDSTGSRLITWGSNFKFSGGTPPTLSTAANALDEFMFSCDGTNIKLIAGALDLR